MKQLIERREDVKEIVRLQKIFKVVALLGPRQCGKTTMARQMAADHYFDLENPRDIVRLETPQITLEGLKGLIVIDEIQRIPELFPLIRYLVDTNPRQKYLILGSASRDLIRQGSESLAGRIGFHYLGGLTLRDTGSASFRKHWLRGGLPLSFTPRSEQNSITWREQYITTFLERDIPQLGIQIPAGTLRRFWTMLSHYHGQLLNYSELGRSFGVSDMTVRKYIDILEGTFMIRVLQPWYTNTGKRVVKTPKLYLRDSGLLHSLMQIPDWDALQTHNKLGASFEGYALEEIGRRHAPASRQGYFWRTAKGVEIDLFWQDGGRNLGVEIKYQDAPRVTSSMRSAVKELELDHLWVVYPGKKGYPLDKNISVVPITGLEAIRP